MIDHSEMKLGKSPAVHDPRTLALARYTTAAPTPPAEVHRSHNEFAWPMFLNDQLGDCTIAAAAHMRQSWAFETGRKPPTIPESGIVSAYYACSGGADNGCVELDVLNYWRKTGIAGDILGAFGSVNWRDATQVRQAIYLFGGCYIGLSLPLSAQRQSTWDVPVGGPRGDGEPGSWGGHAVNLVSYDSKRLACITWGSVKLMTWRFFGTYADEAYSCLSHDMLSGTKSPQGLNWQQLQADLP